jgi:predicted deacetylase
VTLRLVVSIHDVAPSTAAASRRWADQLAARGVPATLLVIPGPWEGPPLRDDEELVAWLHERVGQGDEVAQHGWTHRRAPGAPTWRRGVHALAARGCAEFGSVDRREALRRLSWGRRVLDDLGFAAVGFTPPGWLASPATRLALRELGYRYTTSHARITDLRNDRHVYSFVWSHRAGGASEAVGATVLAAGTRRVIRAGGTLRLALHPADLAGPALVRASLTAIDEALAAGATATTYQAVVDAAAPAAAA